MKIGFITTSRADFGIYLPLLKKVDLSLRDDYNLFAGGMHMSQRFGFSYKLIEENGFMIHEKIETLLDDDSRFGVSASMGITTQKYAAIWKKHAANLDVVFAMGDRFEMFAAAASLVPFNVPLAHLHGGETTLGAIDNKFRHALTCLADYHFTSHETHRKKVADILGTDENVFNVGALGVDSITTLELFNPAEFFKRFQFDVSQPFLLLTYHPETVDLDNKSKIDKLIEALKQIPEKVLCTFPNADTEGKVIRHALLEYEKRYPGKIKCFENLGQKGYLTAMKYCTFMLGNTSSGIIEAASFNKPVVNIGDRQKGRVCGKNVIHVKNDTDEIWSGAVKAKGMNGQEFVNPYGNGETAQKIIKILEEKFG